MDAKETYSIAVAVSRMYNTIANFAGQFPNNPQTKQIRQDMEKERAQLQLNFGNNLEVIVGADMLSQRKRYNKNDFDEDILTLQDVLKRDGLSYEAKETINRAIGNIETDLKRKKLQLNCRTPE